VGHTAYRGSSACNGWTVMELVVGLGISTLTALAISHAVASMSGILRKNAAGSSASLAQVKVATILRSSIFDNDRARLTLGPVVVSQDNLTRYKHPLASLTGTSAPRPGSDVISVSEVSPLHRGAVLSTSFQGGVASLWICGFAAFPESRDFRSFVALSPAGPLALVGDLARAAAGCGTFSGRAIPSLFNQTAITPQGFIAVWPVRREYSLFIDRSGQFRLVSHVGDRIIENQPIVRGLRALTITRKSLAPQVEYFDILVKATGVPALHLIIPRLFISRGRWNELGVV
jgi:hypothetical protein